MMTSELDLQKFFETHGDLPERRAIEMLFAFKAHVEACRLPRLISTGKLWRARRACDSCKVAMVAGEVRHLFRREGKGLNFESYFICASCEERWEQLGDAGVPNCLAERDNWANWKPEPIDPTRCGDCCAEFTLDNPAKSVPTTVKGPIYLLCGSCTRDWKEQPEQQTPGLTFELLPVAGTSSARVQ
jgi:hypothetical protein